MSRISIWIAVVIGACGANLAAHNPWLDIWRMLLGATVALSMHWLFNLNVKKSGGIE